MTRRLLRVIVLPSSHAMIYEHLWLVVSKIVPLRGQRLVFGSCIRTLSCLSKIECETVELSKEFLVFEKESFLVVVAVCLSMYMAAKSGD